MRELLALEQGDTLARLLDMPVSYTPATGTDELRTEIAQMHGVEPADVQVVTGGAEALLILFHHAAAPGSNVVLPHPGFPWNEAMAKSFGIEVRPYHLRAENQFRIELDEIRDLVDGNTRFVLVNSPHNPTGSVLSDSEMEALHDFCADRGTGFVSDEVYHPIYHGSASKSAARLERATVLGDFSKALCLSGLRMGWLIDRNAARMEAFKNARSYFTVSSSPLSEALASIAIRHRGAIYARAQSISGANLALLDQLFAECKGVLNWVRPAGGMTAFPWLADGGDGREFCRQIARQGVLLAPGDCYGMAPHFRIGFAASGDGFAKALERFATIVCALR